MTSIPPRAGRSTGTFRVARVASPVVTQWSILLSEAHRIDIAWEVAGWAIRYRFECWSKAGTWESEPMASKRSPEFLRATRWSTAEDAKDAARRAAEAKMLQWATAEAARRGET